MGKPALVIQHVKGSSPPAFTLARVPGDEPAEPVSLVSPYGFPVEGQANSDLIRELRWYLEKFLDYPFFPATVHAEHVLDAINAWGALAFRALFDRRATGYRLVGSAVRVCSDDANILSWPWEVLRNPEAGYLAQDYAFERCLNNARAAQLPLSLPRHRVNILLVVARPFEADVGFRSVSRPLIELIQSKAFPAEIDVLRPPTFYHLRKQLRERPGYYHVLHFDGHGAYGAGAGATAYHSPLERSEGSRGCLVFESETCEPDPKSGQDLGALLREYGIPLVVLNACQSAMLDTQAEDVFASVATSLLQSGIHSAVAMAYSLHVSGAQVFLPAFYQRLFESGSVAEGVRAGRQEMLAEKGRVCARGRFPLEDWLVPVLYQRDPPDFGFAKQANRERRKSHLPAAITEHRDVYGFIGRDCPILAMERALRGPAPVLVLTGLSGVGKTTLARGFLRWLDETGGLDGALWFDFRDIFTFAYVVNRIGEELCGGNFGAAPDKLKTLKGALGQNRILIVWDNFESTRTNLTAQDRAELGRFLDAIRSLPTKVIITSRSMEEWIPMVNQFVVPVRGLDGEERWRYCEVVLNELGLRVNRNDPALSTLMDLVAGHPLAMRILLPRLCEMPAAKIVAAVHADISQLGLSGEEEQRQLFGTMRFAEQYLPLNLQPLLGLVGLFEGSVTGGLIEDIARQLNLSWTSDQIDRSIAALERAGLVWKIGGPIYQMHPLLTGYLRSKQNAAPEACQRAFVYVMAYFADYLAQRPFEEQNLVFSWFGANFNRAVILAETASMVQDVIRLTQCLAFFAERSRNIDEAVRLFECLARQAALICRLDVQALAYHHLGWNLQARRDFRGARESYLKAVTIFDQQSNPQGTVTAYNHLGEIAIQERDFSAAQSWTLKALRANEKHGDHQSAAQSYYQLGLIAHEQRNLTAAYERYLESLAISEKRADWLGIAAVYQQLGKLAEDQGNLAAASDWYRKSLGVSEDQDLVRGAAHTYHQLGKDALALGHYDAAQELFLKSLAVSEKQGDQWGAAAACQGLGTARAGLGSVEDSGRWLTRSITGFRQINSQHEAEGCVRVFISFYQVATPRDKQKLEAIWREAGLGPFPKETSA